MKYKKYPSYKDSGVEWLGDIPTHWNTKRLKNVIRASITDGPHETPEFIDEGVPFLSVDGIQEGELSFKKCRYISEDAHNLYKRKAFIELDDILLGKAASIGKVARVKVDFEFSIWSPLALIKPKLDEVIPNYLEYLLKSDLTQYQIQQLSTSNTQQNISMADIPKFNFSLPELKEQQQIANFLDEATAKIDTLIEKQTKQIELLKEKRQAVISHAVTKGINPNVSMKDIGVEWLGEIPEHWELSKLRFLFSFSTGLNITKANLIDEGGIPCVNYGEIHSKYGFEVNANINDLKCVDKEYLITSKSSLLSEGDFIFADTSEDMKGAGNFTHVIGNTKVFAGYHTVIARQIYNYNSKFFAYVFDSEVFRTQIQLAIKGVKVFSITQAILKNCLTWFPLLSEQQEIANYLDEKTLKIDTLIEKSNKSIELLKEKRTALISACVTGKIDVRELV